MMDTILNLGLNDATVAGRHRRRPATRASPTTATAASSPCTATSCSAASPSTRTRRDPFEEILEADEEGQGRRRRHRARRRRPQGARRDVQGGRQGAHRPRLPRRPARAALGRHRRRLRQSWDNDRAVAYRRLYDIPDDWGTAVNVQTMVFGNTGDESGTGVGLHARPGHRRERLLRRVPRQRPGRGRGRRRAHAAAGERARGGLPATSTSSSWRCARRSSASCATCRTSSSPSRRAASTCCRRATASAPAWPPSASPSTWCDEGLITPRGGAHARRARAAQPAAAADLLAREPSAAPSRRAGSWPRAWPPAPAPPPAGSSSTPPTPTAWAARGEKVLLVRDRDEPRGHPRHGRRPGHPHGARRHDLATRRWSPGRWARSASSAARRSTSTTRRAPSPSAARVVKEGDWLSIDGFTGEVIVGQLETRPCEVLQVLLERITEARGLADLHSTTTT